MRKKKSRTKEPEEKPGSSRVSRAGTTIRCGKCKQLGHNKTSCERRNRGIDPAHEMPSQQSHTPSTQPRAAPSMPSQRSTTASTKRKASTQSGTSSSKRSYGDGSNNKTYRNTVNVHGLVQGSQASSSTTMNVSSGKVVAQATNTTSRKKGSQS